MTESKLVTINDAYNSARILWELSALVLDSNYAMQRNYKVNKIVLNQELQIEDLRTEIDSLIKKLEQLKK